MTERMPFLERASDPHQYDIGEVDLSQDGAKQHFTRRMIWEAIAPWLGNVEGQDVLDIGSGYGWLCDELTLRGAHVTGIDPSQKHIDAAKAQYPGLDFRNVSFQNFSPDNTYDLITATLTFEHLADLRQSFEHARTLMNKTAKLLIVTGDFERYTMPRFGYTVEVQQMREGEVAVRTNYGARAGVIYDIFRTTERFQRDAIDAGLTTVIQQAYSVPEWVIKKYPRYALFEGKPIFQVLGFAPTS